MRLFSVPKIALYCEGITHRLETRKSGQVKVVDLVLKSAPFTRQLVAALDAQSYGFLQRMLFKMNDGSIVSDLKNLEPHAPSDRQLLTCFASSDTAQASIALDQVAVTKIRFYQGKSDQGWTMKLTVSFGPLSKQELEYCNAWYTEQRFVTFDEAEPSLEFERADDDEDDDHDSADMPPAPTETPMFDTTADGQPLEAAAENGAVAEAPEPARVLPHRKPKVTKPRTH